MVEETEYCSAKGRQTSDKTTERNHTKRLQNQDEEESRRKKEANNQEEEIVIKVHLFTKLLLLTPFLSESDEEKKERI